MGYLYAGLWALVAVFLLFYARKVSPLLYFLSGFFFFMSAWWLLNELLPLNLFDGIYGIVFRVIVGAVLLALIGIYVFLKTKKGK